MVKKTTNYKRILIHIIARYYLWKFRRQEQCPSAKWRIKVASTGSLYIQRRNNKKTYKDVLRISDHLPTNSNGNPVSIHSKKKGIVI